MDSDASTRPAGKRAAGSDDVTEPADKRSRSHAADRNAENPPPPPPPRNVNADDHFHAAQSGGILTTLASTIHGPVPVHDDIFVTVQTVRMNDYFSAVRTELLESIYPGQVAPPNIITADDWNIVMRGMTKARVDTVYAAYTGRRPANRVPLARAYELPKCVSDVINGIGIVKILSGGGRVVPQPEDVVQGQDPLANLVTHARLNAASMLIQAAKARGLIRTGFLSSVIEGQAWWIMSARNAAAPNDAPVAYWSNVTVFSVFAEWHPSDAMLCAIVQNRFDGLFGDIGAFYWTAGFINSCAGIRASYILGA